ncbi:hypothetical protein M8C21_001372 [Ambrosia artemisiifolia]|uniref:Uncharacterized protein n=1 Tax=Ambrosia artemisiifolia TaxID=4212 RepID=A0AAD5CJ38_AMBAR|nr:hypothetical protein M8C21_001372 [Ambrosia artemisiifolia]
MMEQHGAAGNCAPKHEGDSRPSRNQSIVAAAETTISRRLISSPVVSPPKAFEKVRKTFRDNRFEKKHSVIRNNVV